MVNCGMTSITGEHVRSSNGHCEFHHGSILLLDHQFHSTRNLAASMEEQGFWVSAEADRQEMLELIHSSPESFDLLITDQNMRNMRHSKPIKKMIELRPDMPAILCTENNWAIFIKKLQLISKVTFLSEPTDFSRMIDAIGSLPGSCHAEERRMLVVGERFPMTRVIPRILKDFRFKGISARDRVAREKTIDARCKCFDLVIADQKFKDMTDSQTIREVLATHPEVPIILCTRDHKAIYLSRIAALEGIEFLSHQTDFQEFFRRIDGLLKWSNFWNLR